MVNERYDEQIKFLINFEIPDNIIGDLIASGLYLEVNGGVPLNSYWQDVEQSTMRDEFYLTVNFMISFLGLIQKLEPVNEWRGLFDVAFLFQFKSNIQSICSVDYLTKKSCYGDAFSVLRTLHSRLNLLLLVSLEPRLFDEWLRHPKNPKFLDGHVRCELENNNIYTMKHIYEFASELVHGQFTSLNDIAYLEKGIFVNIPAVEHQIYALSKFIVSMIGFSMLSMVVTDIDKAILPEIVRSREVAFQIISEKFLTFNDLRNLFSVLAKDRHWVKVGKKKYHAGGIFNYSDYREQLWKFHRLTGQKKSLSKEYKQY